MPSSTVTTALRTPARRFAAAAVATVLAAGPAVLATAGPAAATGDHGGKAGAVVLRTGLDVSLLNKTVNVPLAVALNEVQAPASAEKTALTVKLDGVDGGQPFSVLRADVAKARATVDAQKAEGFTQLVHAKVHVPGLPLLSLIEVDQVTSKALCVAGKKPVAESNLLGSVTVLGKKVTLSAGGTTEIKVPGVGDVTLGLSNRSTTSTTAAASALQLKVSVNPLKLNVAEVNGEVTLAGATCESPKPAPTPAPSKPAQDDVTPQGTKGDRPVAQADLAETGGSSSTPYIAGGAIALLLAGAGAVALTRRGRTRA
ncbi:LPXTG cell wall anchor domain-containing protein [Streptomyces kunmingensis]|uniref:LPXTG cell wall anchor domain-containing protein n=1 Tax=Streptomyces kunmingensis TaxID=68225 RepID=A0ABU6C9L5_9ACTN|nr:SCO1860 family LAETG-anchored protein [Streptomyces kunmingensis]MEB3960751.1 LPXTG cell wall anchor domain-containing protein [Streptomyces kunmingensis]